MELGLIGRSAESSFVMESMKFLAVGPFRSIAAISSKLVAAGHSVTQTQDFGEATEALLVQHFDAVLIPTALPPSEVSEFAAAIRQFESQAGGTHTPLLSVSEVPGSDSAVDPIPFSNISGIDGVVPASIDPDSLTLAIARLASAVSAANPAAAAVALSPELPVVDIEELKAQVAYDAELLVELIDLYLSEREKQSAEMQAALSAGDYAALARVAHTIKGSLGSLHASASRATSQSLELAARERDQATCRDFLLTLEEQLDALETELLALKNSLQAS